SLPRLNRAYWYFPSRGRDNAGVPDQHQGSTSAPRPVAMRAAFTPDVPPPTTTTRPGKTPGTPANKTPLPPLYFARKFAPITADMRPAISLIGSSNGKR